MKKLIPTIPIAALLSLLLSYVAQADTANFDDYTVHYTIVNTTFLSADIAEQYGITRGQRKAFLNVSVLQNLPDGKTQAVTAEVNAHMINLMQQSTDISFNEVQEGSSTYYIGEFTFTNTELVSFELLIQPQGTTSSEEISWDTRVYTNN